MVIYTKKDDTKLYYWSSEKWGRKFNIHAGFKAYVVIDSGNITNISLSPNCFSEIHDVIRYQIIGADNSLALVYYGEEPRLELHNSISECTNIVDWYDTMVDLSKVYNDYKIQIIKYCKLTVSYEYIDCVDVAEALSLFSDNCSLVIKDGEKTLLNMTSYEYNGVESLSLTTCLNTGNVIIKDIVEFFNSSYK